MDFETAFEALMNGKFIRKKNDTAWYSKHSFIELPLRKVYTDFILYDEWVISD